MTLELCVLLMTATALLGLWGGSCFGRLVTAGAADFREEPSIHDRETLPEIPDLTPDPNAVDTLPSIPIPDAAEQAWIDRIVAAMPSPVQSARIADSVEWAAPVTVERVELPGEGRVRVHYKTLENAALTTEDLAAMIACARRVLPSSAVVVMVAAAPHFVDATPR